MTSESILATLSIITSSLILALGVWLLTGWYLSGLWPENVRQTAGTLMTLYGLYRIGMAVMRFRRRENNDDSYTARP